MAASEADLRRAVADFVGCRAASRQDIAAALETQGLPTDQRLERALVSDASFAELEGGFVHVPGLLEGSSWTVWIDADDARAGFVRTSPHLTAMSWWLVVADGVPLVDGTGAVVGELTTDDWDDEDMVIGPDGWLDDLAGRWATVKVASGGLSWSPCNAPPAATSAQIAAIRAGFEAALRCRTVRQVHRPMPDDLLHAPDDHTIYEAFVADRLAFVDAPIPPVPELLEAAGLELRGGIVAESGFDWERFEDWRDHNRLALVYELDDDEVEALILSLGLTFTWLDGLEILFPDAEGLPSAVHTVSLILSDPTLADAYWTECDRRGASPDDMARFAAELTARHEGALPIGLAWLQARGLDIMGDAVAALDLLEATVGPDCVHDPALVDLAGLRADRGDAVGAYALLQQASVSEPPDESYGEADEAELLLVEVEGFARHRPRPVVGRNERCPCGSGRKYKACHLGQERHALDDRAKWLYDKAERFMRVRCRDAYNDLADELAERIDMPDDWWPPRDSPFLIDLALHEQEAFAEFVTARDALLPDDEALLAAQWAQTDRGVFEVRRVERDRLELHDIGRGDDITIVNVTPNDRTRKGTVLLGRPLPVGDTYRAFAGLIEIPRRRVQAFLGVIDAGDAVAIAALIADMYRPPNLQNTDGEDFVMHELRWRCPPGADVGGALRSAGLTAGSDATWTLTRDTAGQKATVVAQLRLSGDELTGDVNSDERATEVRALVAAAIAGAELVDDTRRTMDQALADAREDQPPPPALDDDPVAQAALSDFVADYERRWLDESIPALGGRTPREAAADPIGREELEQLLDSLPSPAAGDVGAMDPQRLRSALGL